MADVLTRPTETIEIECPRCHGAATEVFYGPCTTCREPLGPLDAGYTTHASCGSPA